MVPRRRACVQWVVFNERPGVGAAIGRDGRGQWPLLQGRSCSAIKYVFNAVANRSHFD